MKSFLNFHELLFNSNKNVVSKKLVVSSILIVIVSFGAMAQKGPAFGIKAGLNYNANGDYFESIGDNAQNPDRNIGYHIGAFGKFGNQFFLRPELVYTATKSSYDSDDFSMKKIDLPLLVGAKVIGPLNVFAGPSLQYILDTEFEGITIDDIENDFSIGLNFGIGLTLNKVGIDLRYERGFSENEAVFIDNNLGNGIVSRIDTRPDQLILSLSVAF
ncbi:outer membrane beta-barrel protein [Psychroserpens sp. XS_ASV72]|uniref:outer membrane beta-barrel protein n=1 Tax=Psychroserpens sp. XS_ASV72 TaxID=3241293 RepID=UPI00351666F6